jgi:hypothetical protein
LQSTCQWSFDATPIRGVDQTKRQSGQNVPNPLFGLKKF